MIKDNTMKEQEKFLIVVFDGEHARFVRSLMDNVLHTERAFSSSLAGRQSSDLQSDHLGASFHSASTTRHAISPRHDPHDLEKIEFIRLVAAELNSMPENEFNSLVIVAPAYALNIIENDLLPSVSKKLKSSIAKDLIKTPDDELWSHLSAIVPPARPPRFM